MTIVCCFIPVYYLYLILFQDSTIDFEKRRNIPVRYDRELIQTTVKAMKRVGEIKTRRERVFFKHRYLSFTASHLYSISSVNLEWLPVAKSKGPIAQRSRQQLVPLSDYTSLYRWNLRQRRKKSKSLSKQRLPLFKEKAVRWAWTSINGFYLHVFCLSFPLLSSIKVHKLVSYVMPIYDTDVVQREIQYVVCQRCK